MGDPGSYRPCARGQAGSRLFGVRALVLCAAALGMFAVVLWPSRSFAAIVPACENDFASRVAAAIEEAVESCETGAGQDDIDNSRAAPICDALGVSAIAPPRLRGVSDMRLDRSHGCEGTETVRAAVNPGRGDPPGQAPEALAERAVLPEIVILAAHGEATLIDPPAPRFGPAAGVRDDVYHPPR
ncbi:MAG: hypothetical protein R3B70_14355 [Polyangiaceae bacterium]